MCLPLAALPIIAGGVSAAGSLFSGMQANAQGQYESDVAKRNATMEIKAAHQSVLTGYGERRDYWRKVGSTKGQQIASMAANGIDVDFGAGARTQEDTQVLASEDADNLYRNINERTKGHEINASNFVTEAKAARRQGKAALVGSVFNAAGSILGGVQQGMGMKAKMGTSQAKR
jgi:hypothetical protein